MPSSTDIENNQNLFATLEKGDRKIDQVHENIIMMVGLSRAGKSTCYNWILNVPLKGSG